MRRLAAALVLSTLAAAVHAQSPWPAKPVQLVLANSTGNVTDFAGRIFADHMSRALGRPWLIENRPGANGLIAAEQVARAAPDGYTLFFATAAMLAIDPHLRKGMPIDPARAFTPIAVVIDTPEGFVVVAHPSAPFRTLPGMIGYAKANPGKLSYTTTVPIFVMFGEWLKKRAAIDMVQVPYKNTAQAIQDVVAGTVPVGLQAFPTVASFVKSGKLQVLGAVAPARLEELPDVPTVGEAYPGFRFSWVALVGPAGIPADIVQRINREAAVVVKDPKFTQDLKKIRWANRDGARTPEGTAEFIRHEREQWGAIIREIASPR